MTAKAPHANRPPIGAILLALVWAILCCCRAAHGQPTTVPSTQPATQPAISVPFRIGVWQCPVEDVEKWLARGADTGVYPVDYGGRMAQADWERAVAAKGFKYITPVGDHAQEQAKEPNRAGFIQLDEPDLVSHYNTTAAYTITAFRDAYLRASGLGQPVFLTAGAMDNPWYDGFPKPTKADGSQPGHRAPGGWFGQCDVAGCDWYIYTWGRNEAIGFPVIERILDRLNDWSGGKPIYLFVETCTQGKPYTMTADQWESQVRHASDYCKKKGYRLAGVFYFSHVVFPKWSSFDGTPADVAARMPAVNAYLRQQWGSEIDGLRAENAQLRAESAALRADRDAKAATIQRAIDALGATPTTQPTTAPSK